MSTISVNEWLDYFGFVRHPFIHFEAAGEVAAWSGDLAERFVKPDCFDRVLGQASDPRSVLVFANRGGGKTACRILLDYYAREGIGQGDRPSDETGGRILPVLHTHLHELVRLGKGDVRQVDEHLHVTEILRRATVTLADLLQKDVRLAERFKQLPFAARVDLQWFFFVYPTYLSTERFDFLRRKLGLRAFKLGEREGGLGFQADLVTSAEMDLSPEIIGLLNARLRMPPIDQLAFFVTRIAQLGFRALYAIVDGLDELSQTADISSEAGVVLLEPLLTNLDLMTNTPGLAFKVFIPAELEPFFRDPGRPIRRDRLLFERIVWTDDGLLEILHRRLSTSSRGHAIQSLDAVSVPELRGRLEKALVRECRQNPRHLIWLARFLIEAHCSAKSANSGGELDETDFLLDADDLEQAVKRFKTEVLEEPVVVETVESALPADGPAPAVGVAVDRFPAPIALVYLDFMRRLEAMERVQRLLDVFEVTVVFVGAVLLGRLYALVGDESGKRLRSSQLRLGRMSLGGWLTVWERVAGICSGLGDRGFGRRFQRLYNRLRTTLTEFRDLRNEWAHGATQSSAEYYQILDQYVPKMNTLLAEMRFLQAIKLVQVDNLKLLDGRFVHQARVYVGDNPNFPWEQIEWAEPLPSDQVLLLYGDEVLSLYPCLIVSPCPECRQDELFLYQKILDRQVVYLSFHTGHRLETDEHYRAVKARLGV